MLTIFNRMAFIIFLASVGAATGYIEFNYINNYDGIYKVQ